MTTFIVQKLETLFPKKRFQLNLYDKLLMTSLPYYLLLLITMAGYLSMENNAFIFIFIIYSVLPLLDQLLSLDWRNPNTEERLKLQEENAWYKGIVYLTAIANWMLFFKVMNVYANYEFSVFTILNFMGLLYIFSNLEATQFAIAHEIFHKQNIYDRFFGTIHMSKLLYMHFTYEHLWGHHRRVATPEDPASAEKGINVYRFMLRSFLGSYKSVYEMQKQLGKPLYKNTAAISVASSVLFTLLMYRVYGTQAVVFYLITAFGAVAYLEAINYIEHYGLRRKKLPNGEYEKVTIHHSWNAPHRISNYLLFKLQRHSDHHQNSLKPYQTLLSLEDSPQLSHGYSLTILMSLFPSTWYAVMDPLVDEYCKLKTGNINGQVREKANKLIRYFIIQLTIGSLFLIFANNGMLHLKALHEAGQLSL